MDFESLEDGDTYTLGPVNDETDLTTLVGDNGKFRALVRAKFSSNFGKLTWGDVRVWTKDEFLDEFGSDDAAVKTLLKKWMEHYELEARFKAPAAVQQPPPPEGKLHGDVEPPKKKIRQLKSSEITAGKTVTLHIDSEAMLNPRRVETIKYFGRPGLKEVFEELVDDQTGKTHFNISLVGAPGMGKSSLVFAAAEFIAFKKKKTVLWVGRRFTKEVWNVKLFSGNKQAAGELFVVENMTEKSLQKILQLPLAKDVEVLIVDAPTQADNSTGEAGADAFQWAGKNNRVNGRRVIHVSSLGTFANKQTIRDQVNLREVSMNLFTRRNYIDSLLSDPDLKRQVCDTLQIGDPRSVSAEDVVDQKFFFSGINARWFYNGTISEIKEECREIIERLDKNVSSTGLRDRRAVHSAVTTIRGDIRLIYVYTSCHLAQSIGSSKGSYHKEFLELFPFVEHTLGSGTPGDVFESDFRFHLEQCHSLRDAQIAIMGPDKAEDVQVVLGRGCDSAKSELSYPAGKISILPDPPADPVAFQRTNLSPANVAKVAQWLIPKSKTQLFFDFLVLTPQQKDWLLVVIQNTVAKPHSADVEQLKRVVGGFLLDGFVLEEKITIVYVVEDREKSGTIAATLHGSKLDVQNKQFELAVVHSVYARIAAVPK